MFELTIIFLIVALKVLIFSHITSHSLTITYLIKTIALCISLEISQYCQFVRRFIFPNAVSEVA